MTAVVVSEASVPMQSRPTARLRPAGAGIIVALCAGEAGGVHLLEAREHGAWWWAAGVFFVAIGLIQVGLAAALLWRRRAWLVHAMLWANAGTAVLYVVSRTVGLPGSPGIPLHGATLRPGTPLLPGGIEPVVGAELAVLVAEVVAVLVCATMLADKARRRTIDALWLLGILLLLGSWVVSVL